MLLTSKAGYIFASGDSFLIPEQPVIIAMAIKPDMREENEYFIVLI
jgi:hypothetical protein